MKTTLLCIVLSISAIFVPSCPVFGSPLETGPLANKLREFLPRDSRWGLSVVDQKSGKEIFSLGNPGERFVPASLMKLFTAGAALEMDAAGKLLPMTTDILYDGTLDGDTLRGNIYLRGNGNCLLTEDDLKKAAQSFKEKGIGMVTGRIVADASRFDTRGLERTRKGSGHAPVSALGMDLHTVAIIVEPGGVGKPPKVTVQPPDEMVRFAVAARTVASGTNSIEVKQIDDGSYRVNGDIPLGSTPERRRFPLSDPASYAAGSLRTILRQAGISIPGAVLQGRSPEGASLLVSIPGPTLQRYITEMNINSLNVAADNLLLALGGSFGSFPANREMGLNVLKGHSNRHGLSDGEVTIADGSGLQPGNRVSPRAMTRYLFSVARQKWFGDFRDSLPRPGLEGTVKGSALRNERFRVKTGSLESVTALAGYGVGRSGREMVFAFIVESPGLLPPNAQKAADEILRFLSEQ